MILFYFLIEEIDCVKLVDGIRVKLRYIFDEDHLGLREVTIVVKYYKTS